MKRRRFWQVMIYGWKDAKEITKSKEVKNSRISVYFDILTCFKRFYLFSNQYKDNRLWGHSDDEKKQLAENIGNINKERDDWLDNNYENRKFLSKYSQLKYETSPRLMLKRQKLYGERYNMGKGCVLQNDVIITREHNLTGSIRIGNNVLLSKHVFIDYSGDVEICDNVKISNGVIIESHTHVVDKNEGYKILSGNITLEEGVSILSRAFIADTCHRIGRHARIGADSCVRTNIPPYALVAGNPAKVIGFLMSPEEIVEFEKRNYTEEDRIPIEVLEKNYDKYYRKRWKTTKEWLRI